ncbi:MAG: NUDIX domain-containing protein [Clostridia bacterium]|nr:NUDIX domain-containing protein [Clostridia bacterium]MBQ7380388.1 NUDIX domain-containing protein [Clostridia bacterium]
MEKRDLFDASGKNLGTTIVRGDPMPEGTYVLSVSIFTVNDKGELLLTLRAPEKPNFPNMWEITAGGAIAGESGMEAALRELREETGLKAKREELQLLQVIREPSAFVECYLYRTNIPASAVVLQDKETVAARFVSIKRFEELLHTDSIAQPVAFRYGVIRKDLYCAAGLGEV